MYNPNVGIADNHATAASVHAFAPHGAPAALAALASPAPQPPVEAAQVIGIVRHETPIAKRRVARCLSDPDGAWSSTEAFFAWARTRLSGFEEPGVGEWGNAEAVVPRDLIYQERPVPTLAAYADLVNELARDRAALVQGRLKPSLRQEPDTRIRRLKANFNDVPTSYLVLDVDGIEIARVGAFELFDLLHDGAELEAFCDKCIEGFQVEWLNDADYVAWRTSSSGFSDLSRLSFRLVFQLSQPLCGAQLKTIAEYLGAHVQKLEFRCAPGKDALIDPRIYDQSRILFTAPAWYRFQQSVGAKQIQTREGWLRGAVARLVEREHATVTPPRSIFGAQCLPVKDRAPSARVSRSALGILAQLADGKTNEVLLRYIINYCHTTPERLWDAAEVAGATRRATIDKGMDPDQGDRIRFTTVAGIEKDFERLRAKLAPATFTNPAQAVDALSIDEVRVELLATVEAEVERSLTSPSPRAVLIPAPPGAGKTRAFHETLTRDRLTNHSIHAYGPTKGQGRESVERARSFFEGQEEFARTHIRQRIGRKDLCEEPEFGRLATIVEQHKQSPLEHVCPHCPLFVTCLYPAQWRDNGPGLIVFQHQHATTSATRIDPDSKNSPDLNVVDEGLISSLIAGDEKTYARFVDDLRPRGEFGGVVRRRRKRGAVEAPVAPMRTGATADLHAGRAELCQVLEARTGRVKRDELSWFAHKISVETKGARKQYRRRSAHSMEVESEHQRWLTARMRDLLKGFHAANKNEKKEIERTIEAIGDALAISRFAHKLFFAIEANLNIPARDEALGIYRYLYEGSKPKARCHLRARLPRVLLEKPSIWLDGTADLALFRDIFGAAGTEIPTPHQWNIRPGAYHLTQYPDRPFSKRMLLSAEGAKASANIRRVHAFIVALAQKHQNRGHDCFIDGVKKDVLVVCQLPVRKKLEELDLPGNVALEHFNAVRGIDRYRDVPCGVFIGRPEPKDTVSEMLAEAFYFDNPRVIALTRMADWQAGRGRERYRGTRRVRMADGRVAEFPCEAHPDEHVEALRQQLVNAEVRQAVLRMRPYGRADANPAEMHVFGDVDVGLPVHEIKRWVDAEVTPVEAMAARRVVFLSAASATQAYPDIFHGRSKRTVEALLARERALPQIYTGLLRDWSEIEFRLTSTTTDGRTAYRQVALVNPLEEHPGALIANRLGAAVEWRRGEHEDWRRADASVCRAVAMPNPIANPVAGHAHI